MKQFLNCSLERSILVDVLSAVFGLGSWIAMTGLWVELPHLVQNLPEGWRLASYLSLILQVANIGPILYGVIIRWRPQWMGERGAIHGQLGIGAISTFLLIFFWSSTVNIKGNRHSIALFVLSFGLSIVDCTSSVVFLPYMANFRSIYLVPYLVGEGFSGLLPSLMAIAQGIENKECKNISVVTMLEDLTNVTEYRMEVMVKAPRFSAQWFFGFLFVMVLVSWAAFILLDNYAHCKKEMVSSGDFSLKNTKLQTGITDSTGNSEVEVNGNLELQKLNFHSDGTVDQRNSVSENSTQLKGSSKSIYLYLLFLQGWASVATFGIFPAIQTFSCLPYGEEPFHQAVTFSGVAYPVACFLAMFVEVRNILGISLLSLVATIISAYIMLTAVLSPDPPLAGTKLGSVLLVLSWVSFIGIFSYVKTMATILLGDRGHEALFWCGAVTQGGAAVGALLMFILVNVFNLFQDEEFCV